VYTGDPGSKTEDAIQNLNNMRRGVTERYQQAFQEIVQAGTENGDPKSQINAAVALYLATYFDANPSGQDYHAAYERTE